MPQNAALGDTKRSVVQYVMSPNAIQIKRKLAIYKNSLSTSCYGYSETIDRQPAAAYV